MITGQVKGVGNVARLLNKTLPDEVQAQLASTVRQEAQEILSIAQAGAPKKTGELESELKIRTIAKGLVARIGIFRSSARGYIARFLEFGVRPHTIEAKNRKTLRFGSTFSQSVNHPGIKPTGWLVGKSNNIRADFQNNIRVAITNALRKVNGS